MARITRIALGYFMNQENLIHKIFAFSKFEGTVDFDTDGFDNSSGPDKKPVIDTR